MAESIRSAVIVRSNTERADRVTDALRAAADAAGMRIRDPFILNSKIPGPDARELVASAAADAIFTVGGDGFLLDVVRWLGSVRVFPIVGWHAGTVGFLMNAVPADEALRRDVDALMRGEYECVPVRRLVARVRTADGEWHDARACNEVVLTALRGQAAHFQVEAGGCALGTWAGHGVSVATVQGSTGYNMNAGGAVLDWSLDAFTVVMSHPLRHRAYAPLASPLVLAGTTVLRATVINPTQRPVCFSADGDRERWDRVLAMEVMIARDEPPITLCFPHAQGGNRGRRFLRQFARTFLGVGDAVQ